MRFLRHLAVAAAATLPMTSVAGDPCPDAKFKGREETFNCLAAEQAKIDRAIHDELARVRQAVKGRAVTVPRVPGNDVGSQLKVRTIPVEEGIKRAQASWAAYRDRQCGAISDVCSGTGCAILRARCVRAISEARLRDLELFQSAW
jgi:uncharacterized protein YecT (DUF1311 family)